MSEKLSLHQVRAVIAVCEEGSFTRAALREHATQSGISQHIAAVERSVGVRLFERSASSRVLYENIDGSEKGCGGRLLGPAPEGGGRPPAGTRYYRRCIEAVG